MVVNSDLAVIVGVLPGQERLQRGLDLDEEAARLEGSFVVADPTVGEVALALGSIAPAVSVCYLGRVSGGQTRAMANTLTAEYVLARAFFLFWGVP